MFTKKFLKDSAERAVKTAAQTSVALLTADGVLGLLDVDWGQGASVVGLAALVSLLTSVASAPAGDAGTASAVRIK
ncbi:MAG TPA: holin [Brevibacterium sp.]|jgi:hypothetical protein|nr:holin [Brevibacterium sp.]